MRVVIVSKTFVAATAQRQLEWLGQQPGIELALVTPAAWHADDGRVLPFEPRFTAGYSVHVLPVVLNGRYHVYTYRGLSALLRKLAPEIVHIDEEPYNAAGAQCQRAAQQLGARTVFVAWQNLYRVYPLPFSALERYNYRRTAHIIAGNAAAAGVLRRKGYGGPLSTFSVHGVDPIIYAPQPHGARYTQGDTFTTGYVGRLVTYKGVGVLLDALADLPARYRLRLAGSGPDEAALRQRAAELGIAERVEFLGAVPTTEVSALLAGMDVLALPSLSRPNWIEQFGRTLIEAMACAVPVIGSDSGEIPQVIGDAGIIVPEGNVAALRAAIEQLATDADLRADYAQRGRERVLREFTQEQVARKIAAVYRSVYGN